VATAENSRQEVRAEAKYVHVSARKARLVADLVRARSVPEARTILAFTPKEAARELEKVLRSAVANAESRSDLQWLGDELVVSAVTVDEGPTLKRWRARARGRVGRIHKRTCHITVKLVQGEPAPAARPAPKAAAAPAEAEPKAQTEPAKKPRVSRKKKEAVA
jgi:large subunit ribosomal protein L22